MESVPSNADLVEARAVVARHHPRTMLLPYAGLAANGRRVFAKHEHHTPIRSFKGRGALYALERLSPHERQRGVVTASTGNHGQGLAWAGAIRGIAVTVVVPSDTPEVKTRAIRWHGAKLIETPGTPGDATALARDLAVEHEWVFVEDGEDPGLMAGAATIAWEIFEDLPDPALLVVGVGGGNLIAALALVVRMTHRKTRIIGVQSEAAPAVHDSFVAGRVTRAECNTIAGGLASNVPGELAFSVIANEVDDICLVSEGELLDAVARTLEATGQLVEPAGAAPIAALYRYGATWPAGDAVVIFSGGNIELAQLRALLVDSSLAVGEPR